MGIDDAVCFTLKNQHPKEDPKLERSLRVLKDLIANDENVAVSIPPEHLANDDYLARFVRVRKFDCERALKLIREYYSLRRKNRKLFQSILPSIFRPLFDKNIHVVLKHRDLMGRKVVIFRTALWDPEVVSLDQIIGGMFLILEEMVESDTTQNCGVVFVGDQEGLSLKHFKQFRLSKVLLILSVLQGKFPLKCKGLHNVNDPYWLQKLGAFAKPFFSAKLQKRVHFHSSDYKSFHRFCPPSILPETLGGTLTWEEARDKDFYERIYARESEFRIMAEHFSK